MVAQKDWIFVTTDQGLVTMYSTYKPDSFKNFLEKHDRKIEKAREIS